MRYSDQTDNDPIAFFEPTSKLLYDYWNALRNGRHAPMRHEVNPAAMRPVLPSVLLLERLDGQHVVFRIAGTGFCAAFGREFRDHNFISVWDAMSRPRIRALLDSITDRGQAGLVRAIGTTLDRKEVDCEFMLLPLADKSGTFTRIIGTASITENLQRLEWRKLVRVTVHELSSFNPSATVVQLVRKPHHSNLHRPQLSVIERRAAFDQARGQGERIENHDHAFPLLSNPWRFRMRRLLNSDD